MTGSVRVGTGCDVMSKLLKCTRERERVRHTHTEGGRERARGRETIEEGNRAPANEATPSQNVTRKTHSERRR